MFQRYLAWAMCEQVHSPWESEMYLGHCAFAAFAIHPFVQPIHENFLQRIAIMGGSMDACARIMFFLPGTSAGFSLLGT